MPYHKGKLLYAKAAYAELKSNAISSLVVFRCRNTSVCVCTSHRCRWFQTVDIHPLCVSRAFNGIPTYTAFTTHSHTHSHAMYTARALPVSEFSYNTLTRTSFRTYLSSLVLYLVSERTRYFRVIVIRLRSIHTSFFFCFSDCFLYSLFPIFLFTSYTFCCHFQVLFRSNTFCVFCGI